MFWRLITEKVLTYTEARSMTFGELLEANEAFDELLERREKQSKKDAEEAKKEVNLMKNRVVKRR